MKAMILAAGIGSRLKPLTDTKPKALIEIGGITMLERVIRRLASAGTTSLIINIHHFAGSILQFLKSNDNFGMRIEVSHEPELLDTGGGLSNASWFFDDGKPFFLHNADVYSEIDLSKMYNEHVTNGNLATLSARKRTGNRYFLFDSSGRLSGWESAKERVIRWASVPLKNATRLAFDGIHVISPALLKELPEPGRPSSINDTYLKLAGEGRKIAFFRSDSYYWKDMGNPEKLEELKRYTADKKK